MTSTEQVIGNVLAVLVAAGVLYVMLRTIIRIRSDYGLTSNRGFLWLLAVVFGNLFGVVLYSCLRDKVESFFESLFDRR